MTIEQPNIELYSPEKNEEASGTLKILLVRLTKDVRYLIVIFRVQECDLRWKYLRTAKG